MYFTFNDITTTQAAAIIIKHFNNTINYQNLLDILYLADRDCLISLGYTITGSAFDCNQHGPGLVNVKNITNTDIPGDYSSFWNDHIKRQNDSLILIKDPGDDQLSDSDVEILTKAIFNLSTFSTLPERIYNINRNVPLNYSDVFCAVGMSEIDIKELEELNQYQNYIKELFTTEKETNV
jgi:hypothetical protein